MVHKIAPWLLVVAWMGLIFSYSHTPASESAEESRLIADFAYRAITGVVGEGVIRESTLHSAIRAFAHFFLFFMLGVWFFTALSQHVRNPYCLVLDTTLFGLVYGTFDEIHQYFIPGRAMMLSDILIDTAGALTAALVCITCVTLSKRFRLKKL